MLLRICATTQSLKNDLDNWNEKKIDNLFDSD